MRVLVVKSQFNARVGELDETTGKRAMMEFHKSHVIKDKELIKLVMQTHENHVIASDHTPEEVAELEREEEAQEDNEAEGNSAA